MEHQLLCAEPTSDVLFAEEDTTLLRDSRVVENLLDLEACTMPPCDYFQARLQSKLLPYMRKVVTTWMLEVCEEQGCEEQVFPLAVNLLDRFLCVCPIQRNQLQLLAAVCLLIVAKIRQCCYLSVELLCYYTENSVEQQVMKEWETMVLSRLHWNIHAVTGVDYIPYLSSGFGISDDSLLLVRRHAHTFVALCCTEQEFIRTRPSLLAAASLGAAARGLGIQETPAILQKLCDESKSTIGEMEQVMAKIELAMSKEMSAQSGVDEQQQQQQHSLGNVSVTMASSNKTVSMGKHQTESTAHSSQPETPVDVQDVYF